MKLTEIVFLMVMVLGLLVFAGCISHNEPTNETGKVPTPGPSAGYTSNGFGSTPADYARVNLSPDTYAQWEDGYRTAGINNDPDVYEWWYADFTGEDGTVVAYTLHTRPGDGLLPNVTEDGMKPSVTLIITDPDGTAHSVVKTYEWADFSSATDRCDVRVRNFTFEGDLETYHVGGTEGNLSFNLTFTSLVSPFRPGNGFLFLGNTDKYQAWFIPVPACRAEGTITVDGKERAFAGEGYHDHPWGNTGFWTFIDHWHWGRGSAGKYTIIAINSYLNAQYGSPIQNVLLIDDTETGKRLVNAFSNQELQATESDARPYPDPDYTKAYYAKVAYTYKKGNDSAYVTMTDTDKLLSSRPFPLNPAQEATLRSLGIDSVWYTRYESDITLDLNVSGTHASGIGKGTLEAAQFGLASAPPKNSTTPTS